jgi:hypothetical protein
MKKKLKWAAWILLFLVLVVVALIVIVVNPGWGMDRKQPRLAVRIPRLRADVEMLSSMSPQRDYLHPESLERSALYIADQFRQAGWESFSQHFTVQGRSYQNIVARAGEPNRERIVIGAHYDVCGPQPGADDNASGVAGLLELARLINEQKPQLKYSLELVAYCLEEPPFFKTENMGSFIHVKSLFQENIKVKLMICLEMIGYFSEQRGSQALPFLLLKPFYPGRGNFIAVVGKLSDWHLVRRVKKLLRAGSRIDVRSINAPAGLPGIDFSDHLNYWRYDIPAVMITDTAFFRNPHYHEKSDTLQTLDFAKMAEVVQGVYWTLVNF